MQNLKHAEAQSRNSMGSKEIPVSATGSLALPETAAHREAAAHRCAKATSPVLRQ